jgi:hypothetical protein
MTKNNQYLLAGTPEFLEPDKTDKQEKTIGAPVSLEPQKNIKHKLRTPDRWSPEPLQQEKD